MCYLRRIIFCKSYWNLEYFIIFFSTSFCWFTLSSSFLLLFYLPLPLHNHFSYFAVHVHFFVIKRERNWNGTVYLHLFFIITNISRTHIALSPTYFRRAPQAFSKPTSTLNIFSHYHISVNVGYNFRLSKESLFRY